MSKRFWMAALLATGMVMAPAVQAQSKKELVQKLLTLQQPGSEALGQSIASQTANRVMQAADEGLQRVPADKRAAVGKAMEADIKKFYDDSAAVLRDRAVKIAPAAIGPLLEEKFTEDELKQLIAWAESPVNKKYQQLAPEMENSLVEKLVADTKPTIQPKLATLEQSLRKRLADASGAASAPAASASKPAAKSKN
ncbi:MAG TPA: DUF2059 domain-containing protein [Methylibium sp.]